MTVDYGWKLSILIVAINLRISRCQNSSLPVPTGGLASRVLSELPPTPPGGQTSSVKPPAVVTSVPTGGQAVLTCTLPPTAQSSATVMWSVAVPTADGRTQIKKIINAPGDFLYNPSNKYSINGTYNLVISNVDPQTDGTTYTCDPSTESHAYSGDLIVIDTVEQLVSPGGFMPVGTNLTLTCTLHFGARQDLERELLPTVSAAIGSTELAGQIMYTQPSGASLYHTATLVVSHMLTESDMGQMLSCLAFSPPSYTISTTPLFLGSYRWETTAANWGTTQGVTTGPRGTDRRETTAANWLTTQSTTTLTTTPTTTTATWSPQPLTPESAVPNGRLNVNDATSYHGNDVFQRSDHVTDGGLKSYVDVSSPLENGILKRFFLFADPLFAKEYSGGTTRIQIWRPSGTRFQLVWQSRVFLNGFSEGLLHSFDVYGDRFRVKPSDYIGWTNEESLSLLSYDLQTKNHSLRAHSLPQCVEDGPTDQYPVVGSVYSFDSIPIMAVFSIAVEIEPVVPQCQIDELYAQQVACLQEAFPPVWKNDTSAAICQYYDQIDVCITSWIRQSCNPQSIEMLVSYAHNTLATFINDPNCPLQAVSCPDPSSQIAETTTTATTSTSSTASSTVTTPTNSSTPQNSTSMPTITTTTRPTLTSSQTRCPILTIDLVFLLDSSARSDVSAWGKMLKFVNAIIEYFYIGENSVRVALVRYSDQPNIVIGLNDFTNKTNLKSAILEVQNVTGGSNLTAALEAIRKQVFGTGSTSQKVAIIVTDNVQDDVDVGGLNAAIKAAQAANISMFGVGLLTSSRTFVYNVIYTLSHHPLASNQWPATFVFDYDELNRQASNLARYACGTLS